MVDLGEPCASIIKNQSNDLAIFKLKKKKIGEIYAMCHIYISTWG